MANKRRRFKQTDPLEIRLLQFAEDMRRKAAKAPEDERKALLQRASNADQAIDLEKQLRNSGRELS